MIFGYFFDANLSTSPPKTQGWFFNRLSPVPKGETFHCKIIWVTNREGKTKSITSNMNNLSKNNNKNNNKNDNNNNSSYLCHMERSIYNALLVLFCGLQVPEIALDNDKTMIMAALFLWFWLYICICMYACLCSLLFCNHICIFILHVLIGWFTSR